ncbi:putative membrane-associated kinase regulator 6 [Heracleum sosnowskyi]|uniref:Membrane-associated kinase regulator 6 n=1 Tax=Heracleum sosnowskyi TaxID=360622 RepID=A0AAD8HHV7_9APIA|nr:putative membrane-associated kinase regulator 6 [Heracleum sosnowskyi]
METSQTLSIESFSYSWLANLKPSFESPGQSFRASLDIYDEALFIEIDPNLSSSNRFIRVSQEFNFPISQAPATLVHADEMISNGLLMPFFVTQLKADAYHHGSDSTKNLACPSFSPEKLSSGTRNRCSSLRKCRKLTKKIFQKYVDFLRPLCQRVRGRRSGSRVGTFTSRMHGERNWDCSASTSPRVSVAYSADNWRMSCDSESSIHEAVLHCKRTVGM